MSRKHLGEEVTGWGFFSIFALCIALFFYSAMLEGNRSRAERDYRVNRILAGSTTVKVVDTGFERTGNKNCNFHTTRYVTCENKTGRFNINTECDDTTIPLQGEVWEIDIVPHLQKQIYFKRKIY